MKMLVLSGILIFIVAIHSAFSASLNDEYSVGTSLTKYLYQPKLEASDEKREDMKPRPLWYGPRMGKRSQWIELPQEIIEIMEKIEKSPELQRIIVEKYLSEDYPSDITFLPKNIQTRSKVFAPRYGREASESQNLNSRPYPPRFGRSNNNLPPYLPRLG